ncbi:lysophospholipase [Erysipelothrix inopinata]|uniref:Lysophospholipase n=1 Tax=Erysipelothrix inopinata TaxID=225084 RepID=A0A7G9RY80_9FIRM|nr:alpha/beta fold hydrolase [Erysipelothrix inopinata]QNN60555.1 lysophospholipase [Erysipelothrix inopinata]
MKETFNFLSTNKKTQIHAQKWTPKTEPKAILQIAHGMVEFIDRYDDFANYLNNHGVLVVGHDHLGHGSSVNSEAEWGYFDEGDASQILINDMRTLMMLTKKDYPNVPYFVMGHSMGSFITRLFICNFSDDIDGVVICGTGQNSKAQLSFARKLTKIMSRTKGWDYRSDMINNLAFGGMNKQFKPARTPNDWLSRDEKQVDIYQAEPRCQFKFTLNGYYHLFDICYQVQETKNLEKMRKDLPVFMISGDKDPVGNNGKNVLKVYEAFKKVGMEDVECTLYPDYRHEILNEIDNEVVYADVLRWIESHID